MIAKDGVCTDHQSLSIRGSVGRARDSQSEGQGSSPTRIGKLNDLYWTPWYNYLGFKCPSHLTYMRMHEVACGNKGTSTGESMNAAYAN